MSGTDSGRVVPERSQPHFKPNPLRIQGSTASEPGASLSRTLNNSIERLSGLGYLAREYQRLPPATSGRQFLAQVFDHLGVGYQLASGTLDQFPRQGPLEVGANQPFGGLEGMLLAHLLSGIRPDVKVMANYLLCRVPQLRELFIGVAPFGSDAARRYNLRPLRQAMDWLSQSVLLLTFPAGEVSHFRLRRRLISDPSWSRTEAKLVLRSRASVLPVLAEGRNSLTFQAGGRCTCVFAPCCWLGS